MLRLYNEIRGGQAYDRSSDQAAVVAGAILICCAELELTEVLFYTHKYNNM
jgi:hypothetical protein